MAVVSTIEVFVERTSPYACKTKEVQQLVDRKIDVIKKSNLVRDKAIYKKWVKDRELDEYASFHNMNLVRITDVEFYKNQYDCIEKVSNG